VAGIKITNMAKFYALLLLYEKPRHGYELIHCIGEKLGEKTGPGQIYPFLKKLQKNGLIVLKKSGKREKKVYALTKEGRAFARGIIERMGNLIDLAVEPKLTVCAHCGCKVYGQFHEESVKGKRLRFCCCPCAESYKRANKPGKNKSHQKMKGG